MVDRELPKEQAREKNLETEDDFSVSTARLFELADTMENNETPMFYSVQWNEQRPAKIESLTIMAATVTGARKQEYKGRFNQVQVKITEASDGDDQERQRFIWVRTGYQPVGVPVEFSREALAEDYDYHELVPPTVAQALAMRVQSIDDYLCLTKEMKQRDIPPSPALKTRGTKLIHKFVYNDLVDSDVDLTTQAGRTTVAELIGLLETGSIELAEQIQGTLLNRLLKVAITGPAELGEGESLLTQEQAAEVLEAALFEGIIPLKPHYVERILRQPSLYRYPFVVDLLHATLLKRVVRPHSKNVFGVERSQFACGYIAAILDARVRGVEVDDEKDYMRLLPLLIPPSYKQRGDYLATLVQLADELQGKEVKSPKSERLEWSGGTPVVADLQATKESFLTILRALRSDDPEVAKAEQEADRQHEQIVDIIMRPAIQRRLGREALGVTDIIDPSGLMTEDED